MSGPGVMTTSPSSKVTSPVPLSRVAPTTFSGVSGNGFESLAVTGTVTVLPCSASGTESSLARGAGRDEPVTTTVISVATVASPSVTSPRRVKRVSGDTSASARAVTVLPSCSTRTPDGMSPLTSVNCSESPSASSAALARSRDLASSPAPRVSVVGEKVGSRFSCGAGNTWMGMVITALRASSPPSSTTSNTTEAGPA